LLSSLYEKGLKTSPDKTALIFKDKYLSYSEFDNLVNKSANALYSLGIRRGDRVALYMYNCLELIVLYHTCFKIGAVSVPINDRYQKDEILYVLEKCSPRLFISSDNLIDKVADLDKSDNSIEKVFSLNGSESSNIESWNRFVKNCCPILITPVCELPSIIGWINIHPKYIEKLIITDFIRIVCHYKGFRMLCSA